MSDWLWLSVPLLLLAAIFGASWFRAGRLKARMAAGQESPAPGRRGPRDAPIARDTGQAYMYDLGTGGGTGGGGVL